MPTSDTDEKIKQEIVSLYIRYFGSIMGKNYSEFYADKDLKTVLESAGELFEEYAGKSKSDEIIGAIYKKYNLKPN